MSRYVLTQEQLDRLQDQIQKLSRLNEAKEERIRELEVHKVRVSTAETADLIKTIGKLEDEVKELKKTNRRLVSESELDETKIKHLETLLDEERKLREYSETLTKQVELKCADESLIKDLTKELCQMQKDEIEIYNKRISDLQNQLRKLTGQSHRLDADDDKENRRHAKGPPAAVLRPLNPGRLPSTSYQPEPVVQSAARSRDSRPRDDLEKIKQLKAVVRALQTKLTEIHYQIKSSPVKTRENQERLRELENWLGEIGYISDDLNEIESLRRDLNYLKSEIESKRNSLFPKEKSNSY